MLYCLALIEQTLLVFRFGFGFCNVEGKVVRSLAGTCEIFVRAGSLLIIVDFPSET